MKLNNALDEVIGYLQEKISKINLNNQKSNTGGVLVKTYKGWEEKLPQLVTISFQVIQSQFTRASNEYLPGEAALTATSMIIGGSIARMISREPIKVDHQIRLGDLFIEGFLYHGFAETVRPMRHDESYILKASPKWERLADLPEEYVSHLIVGSNSEPYTVDKTIHKMHDHLYNPEAVYVKAIENLQNVAWCINKKVLNTVLKNKEMFVSEEPIDDNPEREQRRRSKIIELKFITSKNDRLSEWDKFYQAFDIDYRGRIYNTEPFANFQSSDLAKGMFQFYEPQYINEDGEYWLAIHTASSYNQSYKKDEIPEWCEADYVSHLKDQQLDNISVDKMTLNDRALWTVNNMEKILTWASTDSIQAKAEKPVTFLACCYEWEMIEETGLSCLPVVIDGSNNGWQHLGAISKDCLLYTSDAADE